MHIFKERLARAISMASNIDKNTIFPLLSQVPPGQEGDLSLPCFSLGRFLPGKPPEIAKVLATKLELPNPFTKAIAVGPYINFISDPALLADEILKDISNNQSKILNLEKKDHTFIMDFSSPNAAKPFSIGHLRSTVIGNSIKKILEFTGNKVVGINHLGDWGTSFGKLIVAYNLWGDINQKSQGIRYLLDLYVKFHDMAESDPSLEDKARAAFSSLEKGDSEMRRLWKDILDISMSEIEPIYQRLGVKFDHITGESFYENMLEDLVSQLLDKGLAEYSEGAVIIPLGDDIPPVLLKKQDGSTLYATRDLAAALYRKKTYGSNDLLYIVGSEQKLHFQQLALALKKIDPDINIVHVDFGLYRMGDQKMSTRKGNVIFMSEVLDKAAQLTQEIIREKNPQLENIDDVAEKIGTGAIIFGDLYTDRIKVVEFDWDKILDFDGETGPYVQYSYARICGILKKAGALPESADYSKLVEIEEQALLKNMANLSGCGEKAAELYKPSLIARYCVDLARNIAQFYHVHRVIQAEPGIRAARLMLLHGAKKVLGTAMEMLNLPTLEEM